MLSDFFRQKVNCTNSVVHSQICHVAAFRDGTWHSTPKIKAETAPAARHNDIVVITRDLSYDEAFRGSNLHVGKRHSQLRWKRVCTRCVVILGEPLVVTDRDLIRKVIFFETRLFVESNIATRRNQHYFNVLMYRICEYYNVYVLYFHVSYNSI